MAVISQEPGAITLLIGDLCCLFSHYLAPLLSGCSSSQWWWRNDRLFLVLGRGPPEASRVYPLRYGGPKHPDYRRRARLQETYLPHCVSLPTIRPVSHHTELWPRGLSPLPGSAGWSYRTLYIFYCDALDMVMSYQGFKKDHVTTNSSSLSNTNTGYQYKYLFNFFHFHWIRRYFV